MDSFPLQALWDISIAELNNYLRLAGVEPVKLEGMVHDLDAATRAALITALRESVRGARVNAPPVERWTAASQALFMDDDGSAAAREQEENFWRSLTRTVNGCFAQILLGDMSEFPFFIELLKHQPSGHLIEMATDVLCYYVDPSHTLEPQHLAQSAQGWWQAGSTHRQDAKIAE